MSMPTCQCCGSLQAMWNTFSPPTVLLRLRTSEQGRCGLQSAWRDGRRKNRSLFLEPTSFSERGVMSNQSDYGLEPRRTDSSLSATSPCGSSEFRAWVAAEHLFLKEQ